MIDLCIAAGDIRRLSYSKEKGNMYQDDFFVPNCSCRKGYYQPANFKSANVRLRESEVRKSKLLLIEDAEQHRTRLSNLLEPRYLLVVALGYEEGIQCAITQIPQIIIIASLHKTVKSISMCRVLKTNIVTSHIPLLVLDDSISTSDKARYLTAGIDAFLERNGDPQLMLLSISNILQNRQRLERHYRNQLDFIDSIAVGSLDQQFMSRVQQSVDKNYQNPDYCATHLVADLCISRSNLFSKLKKLTGYSTSQYIRIHRLRRGAELLKTGCFNVSEVAYKVGLRDPKYFSKKFKEFFGVTPSVFQKGDASRIKLGHTQQSKLMSVQ